VVGPTCNSSTLEAEAGGLPARDQPELPGKALFKKQNTPNVGFGLMPKVIHQCVTVSKDVLLAHYSPGLSVHSRTASGLAQRVPSTPQYGHSQPALQATSSFTVSYIHSAHSLRILHESCFNWVFFFFFL
jgi:hypothetical protein